MSGEVLLGEDAAPAKRRSALLIAAMRSPWWRSRLRRRCGARSTQVAAQCRAVEEITVSPDGLDSWMDTFRVVQGAEIWANAR